MHRLFALASAGLLDGYRCAIPWENPAAIGEAFPKAKFSTEVFILDRDRITCSSGTAALHLIPHQIRARFGSKLVTGASEQFIVERPRTRNDRQRNPQPECIGPGYQHLTDVALRERRYRLSPLLPDCRTETTLRRS